MVAGDPERTSQKVLTLRRIATFTVGGRTNKSPPALPPAGNRRSIRTARLP